MQYILPSQIYPVPLYPGRQAHVNKPFVFVHRASLLQLCVPTLHSLMSGNRKQKQNLFQQLNR